MVISEFHNSRRSEYELEQLVPSDNIERWISTYGDQARQWLNTLHLLVSNYANDWELTIHDPLTGGTVSVVIAAEQYDAPVVLKIHPPWLTQPDQSTASARIEAGAFKLWNGEGAPHLLANDDRALLLEHITPAEHSPDMTTRDITTLITQISRPIDVSAAEFTSLGIPFLNEELWKRYHRAIANRHEEISEALLMNAVTTASYISNFKAPERWELVHGDFKTKNILKRSDGSYTVIDPSPAVGSRLYDVALWAIDKPNLMIQRSEEAAEYLKVDPQIIGSLAVALAIPEICLASPARAQATLEYVKELTGRSDLERYFQEDFYTDTFMDRDS